MSHHSPLPGGFPAESNPPAEPAPGRKSSLVGPKQLALALGVVAALVVGYLLGNVGGSEPVSAAAAPGTTPVTTSAAPTTTPTPLAQKAVVPSPPVRIQIPDIGVDDDFIDLGLNPDGTLEVPVDYQQVGWFANGAKPGDVNYPPTIIAGHVDSFEGPAVFYDLGKVEMGDQVRITQADGTVAVYVVYASAQFTKAEFPASEVYADRAESEIVLITCTGAFDEPARSYDDNLVVSARLDPVLSGLEG